MKKLLLLVSIALLFACSNQKQEIVNKMQSLKKEISMAESRRGDILIFTNREAEPMVEATKLGKPYNFDKYYTMRDSLLWYDLEINRMRGQLDSFDLELKAH